MNAQTYNKESQRSQLLRTGISNWGEDYQDIFPNSLRHIGLTSLGLKK
ncbi:hypothetical protein M595_3216 [Lyngbya aestuarii BL J]|uniref:Uncharacterized protein n=1 Tax=Lyngbya aestuarii BL J TaxID=1348334 RepID=U7QFR2_9CYAN|nr:hypothetical protein M595_3216 [Lyngbya aestuarii BL J]